MQAQVVDPRSAGVSEAIDPGRRDRRRQATTAKILGKPETPNLHQMQYLGVLPQHPVDPDAAARRHRRHGLPGVAGPRPPGPQNSRSASSPPAPTRPPRTPTTTKTRTTTTPNTLQRRVRLGGYCEGSASPTSSTRYPEIWPPAFPGAGGGGSGRAARRQWRPCSVGCQDGAVAESRGTLVGMTASSGPACQPELAPPITLSARTTRCLARPASGYPDAEPSICADPIRGALAHMDRHRPLEDGGTPELQGANSSRSNRVTPRSVG